VCVALHSLLLSTGLPKHTWFSVHMRAHFQSERCDITFHSVYVRMAMAMLCSCVRTYVRMCTYIRTIPMVPYGKVRTYLRTCYYVMSQRTCCNVMSQLSDCTHVHREPRVFWEDTRQPVEYVHVDSTMVWYLWYCTIVPWYHTTI
jgi:hypothetical protein